MSDYRSSLLKVLMATLVVVAASLTVNTLFPRGNGVPDIGVNDEAVTDSDQVEMLINEAEAKPVYDIPMNYVLSWRTEDTKNCSLLTTVEPLDSGSEIEFVIEPGIINSQRVNSISKQQFSIENVSTSAVVSHRITCDNRRSDGPEQIVGLVEFQISNRVTQSQACKFDYNRDGTIDYYDLGPFALKYNRELDKCSQDITGGNCKLDSIDFLTFESLYNVESACL